MVISDFNPKRFLTFDEGVARIKEVIAKTGQEKIKGEKIITSRYPVAKELRRLLKTELT